MDQLRDILKLFNPAANLAKLNKLDEIPALKIVE